MAECPFLSTNDEKVQCFAECVFYKWEENEGICPFKNLDSIKNNKIRSYAYDFIEDDRDIKYFKSRYEQQY